jgi:beta-mannosidase
MRTAIEAHRRAKPYCMGTMYWQLNDCWPVVSWSGMDYKGRWKALQYFVKEAYKDILVSPIEENDSIKVYLVSDRKYPVSGNLNLQLKDFSGSIIWERNNNVTVKEFSSSVYFSELKNNLLQGNNTNEVVLSVKFEIMEGGQYKNNLYFVNPKDLSLPSMPGITFDIKKEGKGLMIYLQTDKLAKNLFLYSDDDQDFSNNYFDLIPGEEEYVFFNTDLTPDEFMKKIKYLYLNK